MSAKTIAALVAMLAAGCAVTEAEWGGEEVLRDKDGQPLIVNGEVQKIKLPVKLYSNRHWFDTRIDACHLGVTGGSIAFDLNGYSGTSSSNAILYVDTCFKGVATITEKICAAMATSGGSIALEGGAAAVTALASRFVAAGGNANAATVSCKDGNCTVTDGTVTCTGAGCAVAK